MIKNIKDKFALVREYCAPACYLLVGVLMLGISFIMVITHDKVDLLAWARLGFALTMISLGFSTLKNKVLEKECVVLLERYKNLLDTCEELDEQRLANQKSFDNLLKVLSKLDKQVLAKNGIIISVEHKRVLH